MIWNARALFTEAALARRARARTPGRSPAARRRRARTAVRLVVQRVSRAAVRVDGAVLGAIGRGAAVLVGVGVGR